MGIVDDGRPTLGRMDGFQTSGNALQRAHHHKNVVGLLAQHACCAIDGEQVAHVELADELYAHLVAVDFKIHTFKMTLQNLGLIVGHALCAVGLHLCLGVLHHEHTVLVVGVNHSKSLTGQHVEEGFFCVAVVLERLVIVEMVACEVGEQSACKLQSADATLGYGMAGTLHEGIFAALLDHLGQQCIELDGIRCGVRGGDGLVFDVVADG